MSFVPTFVVIVSLSGDAIIVLAPVYKQIFKVTSRAVSWTAPHTSILVEVITIIILARGIFADAKHANQVIK